ncbi:MAG: hypothetical protein WB041_05530 [Pseudolabrys sp.]
MNNIIWLVGAIVIVLFILGALGLRPEVKHCEIKGGFTHDNTRTL